MTKITNVALKALQQVVAGKDELVLPAPVVVEVSYMLQRRAGSHIEALFLRSLVEGAFQLVDLTIEDYARVAELVTRYGDLPLGMVDTSVVAVAERLKVDTVATLDLRHFRVVRPRHATAFTLTSDG
jgi:uncharacterized protein